MGIGDFVSSIFGSTNKATVKTPQVDPNAYHYGGIPNGAADAAATYTKQAADAQGRQAPQAATQTVDYGQANGDAAQGQQARQGQSALANVLGQRAMGGAPTIAQMQADRQMQQAQAGQASMAASARGAGALANAQRNAANNVANTQANISGQAQINGAQEVLNNTNAATAAYGNLRAGDQAQQGQDAGQAQFTNQSMVNQGQANATLQAGQNTLNDAMTQNMTGNAIAVNNAEMTGQMNGQAQQSGNAIAAGNINAGVAGQNASMNQSNGMNVVGMGQGAASAAAGILGKAVGGPVAGRTPYLVGEKGPELIVPKKDGYVLTADQTQQALSGAPSSTINALFSQRSKDAMTPSLAAVLGAPPRADGGPVQSGGAPSTWGTGQEQMANAAAFGPAWDAAAAASKPAAPPSAAPMTYPIAGYLDSTTGLPTKSNRTAYEPLQQADQDTVAKHEAYARQGALPENSLFGHEADDEQKKYETAKYRADSTAKGDKKEASAARKSKLQSVLGDMGAKSQESARGVDTSYHGAASHYTPPSLLALPGRAMGGPVDAGGATAPTVAMPEYVMTPSGGLNGMATLRAEGAKSTGYGANPVAGVVPREGGGPVDAGGAEDPKVRAAYLAGRSHGAESVRTQKDVPYTYAPMRPEEELVEAPMGQPEIRDNTRTIDLTKQTPGVVRAITNGEIDRRAMSGAAAKAVSTATEAKDLDAAGASVGATLAARQAAAPPAPVIKAQGQATASGGRFADIIRSLMPVDAERKKKDEESRLAQVLAARSQ